MLFHRRTHFCHLQNLNLFPGEAFKLQLEGPLYVGGLDPSLAGNTCVTRCHVSWSHLVKQLLSGHIFTHHSQSLQNPPWVVAIAPSRQWSGLPHLGKSYSILCLCSGWPTGYGKKLSSSQEQLGQATCLALAYFLSISCGPS